MNCFPSFDKRKYHCKIILLDETELIQEIYDSSKGQDLLNVVFKHLNILETAYFGLRFIDSSGQTRWLDSSKSIGRQTKNMEQLTFYFAVKFYASDPCKLLEEITRYQFFLQIKQDILQSRLPVPHDILAQLFAYAVQSELGDFDPRRHLPGYVKEFRFTSNQTPELEERVADLHKTLAGQVPATAEMNFLERVKWLDLYGADLHPVLGEDNVEYFLGLTPSGVIVLRNKSKVGNYFWPRIVKISQKDKYFMLKIVEKNNESNTYGFELPSKNATKHLWKCCTEHQAFFKLTQNTDRSSGRFGGFTSRFRHSIRNSSFGKSSLNRGGNGLRDRSPSAIVRVPSRRYHRGSSNRDESEGYKEAGLKDGEYLGNETSLIVTSERHITQPVIYRSTSSSVPNTLMVNDSPKSTRSAPWENPHQKGLFSSCGDASPKSVRSSAVTRYQNASSLGRSHVPLDQQRNSMSKNTRLARASDNESEVSRCSRHSHHSMRSSGSHHRHRHHHRHSHNHKCKSRKSGDESEAESESSRRRHRRRKHCCKDTHYTMADSGQQWREIQEKQRNAAQNTAINSIKSGTAMNTSTSQFSQKLTSGYINPGMENESDIVDVGPRQKPYPKSVDPVRRGLISNEIKKHIDYDLVIPNDEDKRNINYTKVEGDTSKIFKIRYSPDSNRVIYKPTRDHIKQNSVSSDSRSNNEEGNMAEFVVTPPKLVYNYHQEIIGQGNRPTHYDSQLTYQEMSQPQQAFQMPGNSFHNRTSMAVEPDNGFSQYPQIRTYDENGYGYLQNGHSVTALNPHTPPIRINISNNETYNCVRVQAPSRANIYDSSVNGLTSNQSAIKNSQSTNFYPEDKRRFNEIPNGYHMKNNKLQLHEMSTEL